MMPDVSFKITPAVRLDKSADYYCQTSIVSQLKGTDHTEVRLAIGDPKHLDAPTLSPLATAHD